MITIFDLSKVLGDHKHNDTLELLNSKHVLLGVDSPVYTIMPSMFEYLWWEKIEENLPQILET